MDILRTAIVSAALTIPMIVIGTTEAKPAPPESSSAHHSKSTGTKARFGVQFVEISPELREHFGGPKNAGILVNRVLPNSAAAKAKIRPGDLIISLNDSPVSSSSDMIAGVNNLQRGAKLRVAIIRNRKRRFLNVSIEGDAVIDPYESLVNPFSHRSSRPHSPFPDTNDHGILREYRMPFPPSFKSDKELERRVDELEKRLKAMERKQNTRKS